jgi:hypothetical protein
MKHLPIALVIVMMICISGYGEEITFSFKGTVHELDGQFSYFTGHPFEITYSFESTTEDSDPGDSASGIYIGAIRSGSLTIFADMGTYKWAIESDGLHNTIEVKNLPEADSYFARARISGPESGNEIPASFIVEFTDRNATALKNDSLPHALEIRSFDQTNAQLTFIGEKQYIFSTIGVITSANAPVPHP